MRRMSIRGMLCAIALVITLVIPRLSWANWDQPANPTVAIDQVLPAASRESSDSPLLSPSEVVQPQLSPVRLSQASSSQSEAVYFLTQGEIANGVAALQARLVAEPTDDEARFGLGLLQLAAGVERLSQSLYRYGIRADQSVLLLPGLQMPPPNPQPEAIAYTDFRQITQNWLADLTQLEQTLTPIQNTGLKLAVPVADVHLDLNGDGVATEKESVYEVLLRRNQRVRQLLGEEPKNLTIAFDYGDVIWLRGYCNLLSFVMETLLAHDEQRFFESTAHLAFAKVKGPYPFLDRPTNANFLDFIAAIHLIQFPVIEPDRMGAALKHLQTVTALSRQSWQAIMAETDDDREWLPNPKQQNIAVGEPVTQEMITGWLGFLDESDTLLTGKKLLPFWRGTLLQGINLAQVFTKPEPFDLVLWVQGTAAAPFLERGKPITEQGFWQNLWALFQGSFFGFAVWFN